MKSHRDRQPVINIMDKSINADLRVCRLLVRRTEMIQGGKNVWMRPRGITDMTSKFNKSEKQVHKQVRQVGSEQCLVVIDSNYV